MALLKNVTRTALGSDVVLPNCYIKVDEVHGNKHKIQILVAFMINDEVVDTTKVSFAPSVADSSDNFIKQAYEHLKTLPEFSGATDV